MDRQLFRPEVVDKITSEHGAPLFLGLRQLSMLTWATMLALVIVCAGACLIPIRTLIPTPGVIVRDGTTESRTTLNSPTPWRCRMRSSTAWRPSICTMSSRD